MINIKKNNYAYVTKSSNILSIIFGVIIVGYAIYTLNNSLNAIILGLGLGMLLFSTYELLFSKLIKENTDLNSNVKIIDFDKYIVVNKYNTPLSLIIGLSLSYVGVYVLDGLVGMVILGFGIELAGNLIRILYHSEKNPLF